MKTMSVRELRLAMPNLKETLTIGGEVLLVSNGEPIARLLPVDAAKSRPKLRSLKAFRATLPKMSISSAELIRLDRDRRGT